MLKDNFVFSFELTKTFFYCLDSYFAENKTKQMSSFTKGHQCCEHRTDVKAAFVFSVRWCLQMILTTVEIY